MSTITQIDTALAATNAPSLSDIEVSIGDRSWKVVFLKYAEQVKFLALLQPLMESLAGKMAGIDSGMTAAGLLKYCGGNLPEMAAIVCRQTDSTVTAEQLVAIEGVSPFKLASIVVSQIKRNQMIEEIVSFFEQIVPLMKMSKTAK